MRDRSMTLAEAGAPTQPGSTCTSGDRVERGAVALPSPTAHASLLLATTPCQACASPTDSAQPAAGLGQFADLRVTVIDGSFMAGKRKSTTPLRQALASHLGERARWPSAERPFGLPEAQTRGVGGLDGPLMHGVTGQISEGRRGWMPNRWPSAERPFGLPQAQTRGVGGLDGPLMHGVTGQISEGRRGWMPNRSLIFGLRPIV
jgi:hypothetical protein